ncbi:MAG: rod shape-determining protein MreC [Candidatus Aminicenantes bacterium]|nr:rod shape-determining protein MreC [Candidatus Aminicenantes bacterium]
MHRNEISTERKALILITVLFLNLILISTNVVLKNKKSLFQNIVGSIVSPFQVAFRESVDFVSQGLKRYVFLKNLFKKYSAMKKKQSRLKYENYLLRQKIADEAFLSEVKNLRRDFIEANVISIDPNFPLDSILIDAGSKDGIVKGMAVLNRDAELVGKTAAPISVFSARVRLITSATSGVGAYIEKDKLEGLLKGSNEKICLFKYLIENKPAAVGDEIITSGTDRIFPPYIPIGRVVEIEKKYLIQDVYVKPYFLGKPIKKLLIIKKRTVSENGKAPGESAL